MLPHVHRGPSRLTATCPSLGGCVEPAPQQHAVEDDTGAHMGADRHRGDRGHALTETEHPVRQRERVDVVIDEHPVTAPLAQDLGEREIGQFGDRPAVHRLHLSLFDVHRPRKTDANPRHAKVSLVRANQDVLDQPRNPVGDRPRPDGGHLGGAEDGAIGPHQAGGDG